MGWLSHTALTENTHFFFEYNIAMASWWQVMTRQAVSRVSVDVAIWWHNISLGCCSSFFIVFGFHFVSLSRCWVRVQVQPLLSWCFLCLSLSTRQLILFAGVFLLLSTIRVWRHLLYVIVSCQQRLRYTHNFFFQRPYEMILHYWRSGSWTTVTVDKVIVWKESGVCVEILLKVTAKKEMK